MRAHKPLTSLFIGLTLTTVLAVFSGCSTINSGMQSGDIPTTGAFIADNGLKFNVQTLSADNLPSSTYPSSLKSSGTAGNQNYSSIQDIIRANRTGEYRIASGDVLTINLIAYPEITPPSTLNSSSANPYAAGYPVDQQGYIQFPLIGRIKASGLTVNQFTNNLRSQLQRYLKFPDPQVKIVNYRGNKFYIDGGVKQPGEFSITDTPVSLNTALSMAGGTTLEGDANSLTLIRNRRTYNVSFADLQKQGINSNQVFLQNGDTLHVNKLDRNRIFVLGEFGNIDPVLIPEQGLSLAHVLGQSKGLNSNTADATKIYVVRDHGPQGYTDIYQVNLQNITNLALINRFTMQPNDIVYVDPTGLTRWSRFVNSILPSTSAIRQLTGL